MNVVFAPMVVGHVKLCEAASVVCYTCGCLHNECSAFTCHQPEYSQG